MKLSIIIPTLNEGQYLGRLLKHFLANAPEETEIIVVDGGSTDTTLSLAKSYKVRFFETEKGRAKQMNKGAQEATGDILYFVHADTMPPACFYSEIKKSIQDGKESGCFRFKFDSDKWILRVNNLVARLNLLIVRGGDQSLFVKKDLFNEIGGFDNEMVIMEEYPVLDKLMKRKTFKIVPKKILISDRKYHNRSWRKVLRANAAAFRLFKKGKDSKTIRDVYCRMLG